MELSKTSALIQFKAENVFSFKEELFLSFQPEILSDELIVRVIPNVAAGSEKRNKPPHKLLPVLGILGANASGKSNALKALAHMRHLVNTSFLAPPDAVLPRPAFRGNDREDPTSFQVEFLQNGIKYEYGFSLNDEAILEEWAAFFPKGVRTQIFERTGMDVEPGRQFSKELSLIASTFLRKNALFLSTCAQVQSSATENMAVWFRDNLNFVPPQLHNLGANQSIELFKNPKTHDKMIALLKAADLGIVDIDIQPADPEQKKLARKLVEALIQAGAIVDNTSGEVPLENRIQDNDTVSFFHQFDNRLLRMQPNEESQGTTTWFGLIGWILDALSTGEVLLIDELDSSLHPLLVQEAIQLFQDPLVNTNFAQLIFNGHTLSILDMKRGELSLRRDQIFVADKGSSGSSTVYPLSDVAKFNDESLAKRYLQGYYGGLPSLKFSDVAVSAFFTSSVEAEVTKT